MRCSRHEPKWAQVALVLASLVAAACGGTDPDVLFAPSHVGDGGAQADGALEGAVPFDASSTDQPDHASALQLDASKDAGPGDAASETNEEASAGDATWRDAANEGSSDVAVPLDALDASEDARADASVSPDAPNVDAGSDAAAVDEPPASCVDADPCTIDARDAAGSCVHAPVVCAPVDSCHLAGACSSATGRCSSPPAPEGSACSTEQGGRCNAAGLCSATFVISRVGDGRTFVDGRSSAVRLERRYLDAPATLVAEPGNPVALPLAAAGDNYPFSIAGTATGEGSLSVSADGRYITLAGYPEPPGTPSVRGTQGRVVARVDMHNAVDTSTLLSNGLEDGNVRGAATLDGSQFWVSGGGPAGSSGLWYVSFGQSGGTPILADDQLETRSVEIVQGQLYATSLTNLLTIGTTPSGARGQAALELLVGDDSLSYGFALVDRDPAVAGVDTAYIADGRDPAQGGGIQKWTKRTTGAWRLLATYRSVLDQGLRAIAAVSRGGVVTVLATTSEISGNRLVSLIDDGNVGRMSILDDANPGFGFRGVAFAP